MLHPARRADLLDDGARMFRRTGLSVVPWYLLPVPISSTRSPVDFERLTHQCGVVGQAIVWL